MDTRKCIIKPWEKEKEKEREALVKVETTRVLDRKKKC